VLNFILQALFQSTQHLYEKREASGAGYGSVPLTNGSGSGRPKNMRILRICILIPQHWSYDSAPRPRLTLSRKLDRRHTGTLRTRGNLLTGKGGEGGHGTESYDHKKAWPYLINQSSLSARNKLRLT
jgi:hypothetical protein